MLGQFSSLPLMLMVNVSLSMSLSLLWFVGSHNAITYCLDKNDRSPVDLTQPDMLQKLDKYMKPIIRPFVYKWAIAQVRCYDLIAII